MAVSVIHINNFEPNRNQTFFFDNNIWMFILCPIGNSKKTKQDAYSYFFDKILTREATIIVNSLILSEFTNAYFRLDFNLWKKEIAQISPDYKRDYIGTDRYFETQKAITSSLNKILKLATPWTDNLGSINMNSILSNLGNCDFNDAYYAELVANNRWVLVSDDGDFSKISNLSFCQIKHQTSRM